MPCPLNDVSHRPHGADRAVTFSLTPPWPGLCGIFAIEAGFPFLKRVLVCFHTGDIMSPMPAPSSASTLIVEDNADSAEVLAAVLHRHGYESTCVGTAADA